MRAAVDLHRQIAVEGALQRAGDPVMARAEPAQRARVPLRHPRARRRRHRGGRRAAQQIAQLADEQRPLRGQRAVGARDLDRSVDHIEHPVRRLAQPRQHHRRVGVGHSGQPQQAAEVARLHGAERAIHAQRVVAQRAAAAVARDQRDHHQIDADHGRRPEHRRPQRRGGGEVIVEQVERAAEGHQRAQLQLVAQHESGDLRQRRDMHQKAGTDLRKLSPWRHAFAPPDIAALLRGSG